MSKILFAWELGGGFGHLSRLEPIARSLRAAGHEILFVSKDTECAEKWLAPLRYNFLQAPISSRPYKLARPPANYTEVLLAEGYADPVILGGKVEGWRGIYNLYQPDIVVSDHSPTALLAARFNNISRVQIGNGFELPPTLRPFPSIRPWESISISLLERSDIAALTAINTVARAYSGEPLKYMTDLFDLQGVIMSSFPELDHYGARSGINYAGPIYPRHYGSKVNWPSGSGPQIFVYIRPVAPSFHLLMNTLRQRQANVICVIPGADREIISTYSGTNITIYTDPIDLGYLIDGMDLAVSYGGIGTVSPLLLGGVPLLLIPHTVEQYLLCARVEILGAGRILREARSQHEIQMALDLLLQDPSYRNAATAFGARYADYHPEQAVERAVTMIKAVL